MKIICGTDFSEHADQASRAAAALARRLGDTLVLAHVWDETLGEGLWDDFHDRMSAAVRNRLYDHAVRLRETGASVEEEILSGMPDVELAKLASRLDARLLVVGSLGRRSGEWLLGSVAEHAAVLSPVPTLVVRSAVPFEAWARGERPLKVFVAFDFTGTAEAALRWIKASCSSGSVRGCRGLRGLAAGGGRAPRHHRAVAAGSQPAAGAADPRARAIRKGRCLAGRGCHPHSRGTEHRSRRPTTSRNGARGGGRPHRRRSHTSGTAWVASPIPPFRAACCATRR